MQRFPCASSFPLPLCVKNPPLLLRVIRVIRGEIRLKAPNYPLVQEASPSNLSVSCCGIEAGLNRGLRRVFCCDVTGAVCCHGTVAWPRYLLRIMV